MTESRAAAIGALVTRAIPFFTCVVVAACGGRIAPLEATGGDQAATSSGSVPAPNATAEPASPPNDPVLPQVTSPSDCVRKDPATSIIAAGGCGGGACVNESIEELVRGCPCGSYRLKVRGSNCIEAVESWERSVDCVAKAALGKRLCGIDADEESTCMDLTIPCVR